MVGYDGEDAADRALDRAIDEARAIGGKLLVVSVAEMPLNPEGPQTFGDVSGPGGMIPLVEPEELEPVFQEARVKIEAAGVAADYFWAAGDPADTIVGAAKDRGARLIVLGHHHHGMLSRLLGGDVAEQVKRDAGCDVLVVD